MSRPFSPRQAPGGPAVRINGKIRAREVRVIGNEGEQLGVMPLSEAISLARIKGVDLVEVAPNANPPVCRVVDFGKYKYELEKRQKENKKHQHANKVKEIQLSATIDPHDFETKKTHAIDFLCEDMKVKASLRFRGREMAHTEFGFQVVRRFLKEISTWGHPDFEPKLNGRSINVMISPLPKSKRAKHPSEADQGEAGKKAETTEAGPDETPAGTPAVSTTPPRPAQETAAGGGGHGNNSAPAHGKSSSSKSAGFANSPFEGLDIQKQ
ncbi:MAG: translation initiation factor IF-3 [Verrucomicrobiales bacterium]|nr:translation initiation factor IF-3 [Verrucomicrobiales bacterium]